MNETPEASAKEKAAASLEVEPGALVARRHIMSVWRAKKADEAVTLVVLDPRASEPEQRRFAAAAKRMRDVSEKVGGVLRVRAVAAEGNAFVADLWATGTAEDLPVLRLSPRKRVAFVRRVAKTLEELHAKRVVHGCLCASNVQLDDGFEPVLAELGMVSVRQSFGGDPENVFGFGAYTAPEALEGEPDARSDIFSVGRLLHYLILGKKPDPADIDALGAAGHPGLIAVVRRCTAESPNDRYQTAAELSAALDPLIAQLALAEVSTTASAGAPPPRVEEAPSVAPSEGRPVPASLKYWIGGVGVAVAAGSMAFAYAVGSHRGALAIAFAAGCVLSTLLVPPHPRRPLAIRLVLGAATGALFMMASPVVLAYRAGAEHRLHGNDAARHQAITELTELGRDFRSTGLARLNLAGTDFVGADLRGADLTGADLSGANLWGALLNGAALDGARLSGANFVESTLPDSRGLRTAECDAATQFPNGWRCVDGHPAAFP